MKPWLKKGWCLPEGPDGEFVAAMEDVLEVYCRPFDPANPVVCMDEASKQLIGEVRDRLPMRAGQIEKYDSEYRRLGTANIFMAVEPLAGKRTTQITDRRTKLDWAQFIRHLLEHVYPDAEKIVLAMDAHASNMPKPANPESNEWNFWRNKKTLVPDEDQFARLDKTFNIGMSRDEYLQMVVEEEKKAIELLNGVVAEHPGTPWAFRASREIPTVSATSSQTVSGTPAVAAKKSPERCRSCRSVARLVRYIRTFGVLQVS